MSLSRPLKSLKIRLFSTFQILENCCQIIKKTLTVWKLQTIKVILYSNLFLMFSQAGTFALKLDKSLCPVIIFLFKLGKSKGVSKHICLVFICFLPVFYLCYIYYFGSLIFCCQFVARAL